MNQTMSGRAAILCALLATAARADDAAIKSAADGLMQPLVDRQTIVGAVVGINDRGKFQVLPYGRVKIDAEPAPDGDTIFEIASITKTFTGILLTDMVEHKQVALDDPVKKYLPAEVSVPARDGREITILDLATHTSGLPRMPDNFHPRDPGNPFADYTVEQLYEFLKQHQLRRSPGEQYEYSNVGFGLLGHILSRQAGMPYEELVVSRICEPLGMKDTRIKLSEDQQRRVASGYNAARGAERLWDIPTLPGGGALRSTTNDMLRYLNANLAIVETPLAGAITAAHQPRRDTTIRESVKIGLGWHTDSERGYSMHTGQTGGYHSFIAADRTRKVGLVILSNTAVDAIDAVGVALMKQLREAAEKDSVAR